MATIEFETDEGKNIYIDLKAKIRLENSETKEEFKEAIDTWVQSAIRTRFNGILGNLLREIKEMI